MAEGSTVKVGLFLNQYRTPSSSFVYTDLYEQVDRLEEYGFDSVTLGERHLHEESVAEPITTLGAIAGRTEAITIGTAALLPATYDPLRLAEQVAMLDVLSEGRMACGLAIGYRKRELAPFGMDLEDRVPRFLESLSILKRLWNGERVTHDGDAWQYDDVFIAPTPRPGMPIWIGGHADIAIKRAAYRADGWIASASSTPDDLAYQLDVYEDALEEFGMDRADNEVILMRDCFVGESMEAVRENIEPHLLTLYEWYARWGQTYMDEREVAVDFDELEEKFVLGTPESCAAQLEEYAEMGVDHVLLRVQFPGQSQETTLACLDRLGEEVLPALR